MSVDNTALAKAMFLENVLHDEVIVMGVYAEISALTKAPVQTSRRHSTTSSAGSQTMEDAVRFLVKPLALVDAGVCGVGTGKEAEGAHQFSRFVKADIAMAQGYLFADERSRGIAVYPLMGISILLHQLPSIVIDRHQGGQIGGF